MQFSLLLKFLETGRWFFH